MNSDQDAITKAFQTLLREAKVQSKAELKRSTPPNGFGLFAKEALDEREVILSVTLDQCIVEPRDLPDSVVQSTPGGIPDSFTWDVRLAIKLLEASLGKWTKFWGEYGKIYPAPPTMAQPSLLHRDLLKELQHTAAMLAAQAQQQRLRSLFPELMPAEDAAFGAFPSQLQWTFALTRSRAFAMGDSHFALVPFLDLVNTSPAPNVEFEFVPQERCFRLRAATKIPQGAELRLPLEPLDNQRMFARYGWVEPGGNPHDKLPGIAGQPDGKPAPASMSLSRKRLWAALRAQAMDPDDLFSLSPYVQAVLQSLPLVEEAQLTPLQEVQAAVILRGSLQEAQGDFTSTVEEDVRLVHQIKSGDAEADPRMLPVLLYRVERKTLIASAVSLLASYEQWLQRNALSLT